MLMNQEVTEQAQDGQETSKKARGLKKGTKLGKWSPERLARWKEARFKKSAQ